MIYRLVVGLFNLGFCIFSRVRVEGVEHLPKHGGVIVCANHFSWLDPPLVAAVFPRHIAFMAKRELFDIPILASILRLSGAFPVRRGRSDRRALQSSLAILEDGGVIGLFPEGTRQRTRRVASAFARGAAYLAIKTDAPIVPVGISGSYAPWSRLNVRVGPPMGASKGMVKSRSGKRSDQVDALTVLVRDEIERLTGNAT